SNWITDEHRKESNIVGEPNSRERIATAPARKSSWSEAQLKPSSARGPIGYSNATAVRANDFHDDRQAQPRSLTSRALAAPETVEDARPVVYGYAWPTVENAYRTLAADLDDHFGPGPRMRQRVFDHVA